MKIAVAVFVKTPELSPVKTRLAATLGHDKALEFYKLSVLAVQETLQESGLTPYWAVAEENGLKNPQWQSFPTLHTGDGDLGQRQHHIYETLLENHDRVLLIGADAPQISPDLLNQAVAALESNDFVIGPARDGGYYLFGGKDSLATDVFANIPWSTDVTRACLEKQLPSQPFRLSPLTDVDTQSDLQPVLDEMPDPASQTQIEIENWIKALR